VIAGRRVLRGAGRSAWPGRAGAFRSAAIPGVV